MVQEISAIADQCVCIDPIQTTEQQVIRVHQIVADCWKMTCQSHEHQTSTITVLYNLTCKANNETSCNAL